MKSLKIKESWVYCSRWTGDGREMKEVKSGRNLCQYSQSAIILWGRRKRLAQKNIKRVGFSGFRDQSPMIILIIASTLIILEKVICIEGKIIIKIKEIVILNSIFFKKSACFPHSAETVY